MMFRAAESTGAQKWAKNGMANDPAVETRPSRYQVERKTRLKQVP
jgi:hypothetical protein